MAVAPLFIADMTTLKTTLRLEGAKSAGALAAIDNAVLEVRLGFYRKLDVSRVAVLVALTYSDAPTTKDGVLRALANSTEVKWVRLLLLRQFTSLFLDGSAVKQQAWNDETGFSSLSEQARRDEIKRLEDEINDALEILLGDEALGAETKVNAATIEPEYYPDLPGATLYPERRSENRTS